MTQFRTGLCLLLMSCTLGAQQSPDAAPTFTSSAQLVVRTVFVKDKAGRPVQGLTAKDFTITEDGKLQTVSLCEFQTLSGPPAGTEPAALPQPRPGAAHSAFSQPAGYYRNRRLLAMYFDMTAMSVADQLRALTAARKFVESGMDRADLVALMSFAGGAVRIEQDFTDDRGVLLKSIQSLVVGEGQGFQGDPNDASSPASGAAFGQNDGEFNIFNTDRQLAALQTVTSLMAHLRERKSLLYFAGGIRMDGVNNQAQLTATINAAVRAGVAFWPIDARGLLAQAPLGDASTAAPGGTAVYTGAAAQAVAANFDRSQDTLWSLAADTGGQALLNYNDLSRGIIQVQQAMSSYYVLGYYTANQARDGRYRRVRIAVAAPAVAKVEYEPGYYAGKEYRNFTLADKERQLEEALMEADPVTELTMALEVNFFQLNRAEYFIPVTAKLPVQELAAGRGSGSSRLLIDFIGEVRDEFGATIANLRDKVEVRLAGRDAPELANRSVNYDAGFTLFPGRYTIKILARDATSGRIGTYQTKFLVPDLNQPGPGVPISSVVLSSQLAELGSAAFNAKKGSSPAADPLVQGTRKLIPSVTRVFHRQSPFYVYLQAYARPSGNLHPLAGFVTLYRDQAKVFESSAIAASEVSTANGRAIPLRFDLALGALSPGQYDCQVTVLDPSQGTAAFWRAPVILGP
ncbi:VWA domain-containing protein [Paludibaculum fermentans]|uniref:VWA domain-containing protein n=1 Tax=Paludibaculum fermentans TaxID=1473598 RepID=A0A7S7NPH0_PALFE|nr:VWA domain-containing protein [Paludibaculum fermentans]QOY87391.1 VWA domain-containing protein [Paludibaculum fermentans]